MNAPAHPVIAATDARLVEVISNGASDLSVRLSSDQVFALVAYIRLLERWNTTYNLTSIRDPVEMATHHILDCLAVVNPLRRRLADGARTVLDVGSGAGLPGVVLAIADPGSSVLCVDSVGKKTAFIAHSAASLGIKNLSAWHGRVEQLMAGAGFDVITSRAFASLSAFVDATRQLLAPGGCWMAMKGKLPSGEFSSSSEEVEFHVEQLNVPELSAERCIVWGTLRPSQDVGAGSRLSPMLT